MVTVGLRWLKDKLEKLGFKRSMGVRVAHKHIVKRVGNEYYWAWVAVDILRGRKGYKIYFYAEVESERLAAEIAKRLARRVLQRLMKEGYS
jgi:hypothetical protein